MGWAICAFIAGHGVAVIIHRNHVIRVGKYVAVAACLASLAAFGNETSHDEEHALPRDAGPNRAELRETLRRQYQDGNVIFHEHHGLPVATLHHTPVTLTVFV